jgi:cytochrome c-type biogenesis protein CcmF
MVLSHFGIAVSIIGMAAEAAFIKETLVAARPGETVRVGPFRVRFDGVAPIAGDNWTAIEARLVAQRGEGAPIVMTPQARMFSSPETPTKEAAISTVLDGQLYAVLGEPHEGGRWQINLWWKPLVTLIWLGGALIALGGLLSVVGRWRRDRKPKLQEAFA